MLGFEPRAARWTWTAVCILLLVRAVYEIRETIFILILSILFAYLLTPVVNLVNRMVPSKSRAPALAITYLLLVAILVILGIELGSRVAEQATSLASRAPQFVAQLQNSAPSLPKVPYFQNLKGDIFGRLQSFFKAHSGDIVGALPSAGLKVLSFSGYLLFIVLVPIISFFLLKDGASLRDSALSLIPMGPRREMWAHILEDTNVLLGQYVRAVGLLCFNTFIVFSIVFSIMGLPYGILLASIAFPLEFIPLIGPLVAAVGIIIVAIASGFGHLLLIIGFLAVYRVIQDYVLSPRLMSSGVEIHPLLVILGVLAGEKLGGVPGMFLSVPAIAFLRVLLRRFVATLPGNQVTVVR